MIQQVISSASAIVSAMGVEDTAERSRPGLYAAPVRALRWGQNGCAKGVPEAGRVLQISHGRIGELCLRQRLAAGAMGEVWWAEGKGWEAAVKFAANLVPEARMNRRHRREARLLEAVQHPSVVDLLGTGSFDATRPFIAMELLRGHTLASELLVRGPLSMEAAAHAVARVSAALEHIHQRGIVHRDLKPQNLFVCEAVGEQARVKVIDFGLATEISEGDRKRVAGSRAFMNPDDLLGRTPPGVQSDLWALAVTMYLMLTKRLPFRAHSAGMWQNPLAWRFDPPSRHRAEVPSLVDAWFRRAFSRDPLERFQSAADACREFRGALVKTGGAARSVRPCLSDDELLAFATGSMSPREVQLADAHIAWCEACSDVLSTIAALSFEQTPPGAHL